MPPRIERPAPPPALVQPCQTPAPRQVVDLGGTVQLAVDALDALAECSARHAALSRWAAPTQ